MEKRKLPVLKDLYSGTLELKKGQNDINILLNQPPNPTWIKKHPIAKNVKYIPIERIEYLLTRLFIKWRTEVKEVKLIANSICVTIRLHYQNIENDEWSWQDGIGAAPLQTDKGAGAIEFDKIKDSAVMIAAPAAESYAFKDAAEKIGKLFGKDLNRKDEIIYDQIEGAIPQEKPGIKAIHLAANLVNTSTCDDDTKEMLEKKIYSSDITTMELNEIINNLQINQPKKY